MKEKKGLKVLSARNGIALISVLAILLILTLLLPVMFSMSEIQMKEAVKGTTRQKAVYIARSAVEMGVSSVKATAKSEFVYTDSSETTIDETAEDTKYRRMYDCMKTKTANSDYGVKINDNGLAYIECKTMWLYIKDEGKSTEESVYIYADSNNKEGPKQGVEGYKFVGKADVTITYDGDPVYIDENATGKMEERKVSPDVATTTNGVIKPGYTKVENDNYIVEATSYVNGITVKKKAIAIQVAEPGKADVAKEAIVQYTGVSWSTAPDFIKKMEGFSTTVAPDGNPNKEINYGGVQCFVDPERANSVQKIEYINSLKEGYADQNVYVYSTIGNMYINCEGSALNGAPLKFGVYPGLVWTEEDYEPEGNGSLRGFNYKDRIGNMQQSNFVSFSATNTLEFAMPIELRVNPCRVTMYKNALRIGDLYDHNGTLFKLLALQGRDIVLDEKVDMMISLFPAPGRSGEETSNDVATKAKRAGFLVLSAPNTTPYTYYNEDRGTEVKAGKVYFTKDVYLWFIDYDNIGCEGAFGTFPDRTIQSTIYRTGAVTSSTVFSGALNKAEVRDFAVYKLFNAGDVYYFNAEVEGKDGESLGVNLVNYFMEIKYFTSRSGTIWEFFKDIRNNLYKTLVNLTGNSATMYVEDDLYYIGNMNEDPTLVPPTAENEMYVVWDN